jgi:hypothetical protein
LAKQGLRDFETNRWLMRLDKALKALLQVFLKECPQYHVENVEIKGTCPEIVWRNKSIVEFQAGSLMKLPRPQTMQDMERLRNTTRIDVGDIVKLEETAARLMVTTAARPTPRRRGSCSGHIVSHEDVEQIKGRYLEIARGILPARLITSSRAVVEPIDVAISLAILKSCTEHMNEDQSMPTRRIQGIWNALYQAAAIDRAYDKHRWRVIRNLLEERGKLRMHDRYYHLSANPNYRGQAAKWELCGTFMEQLQGIPAVD